jgi:AAHS family 4-hydroxybenzoate transporter-like MFS transporter
MTEATTPASQTSYDVMHAIDEGKFTPLQKAMYLLTALAVVLDGFDGQMIGYAIPSIMLEWGVTRSVFSMAVASGLVGMAIGSLISGIIADRIGRKPVLIGSVFLFGAATFMIGHATDVSSIAMIRFVAGLGIGAALPAATTIIAEFTPGRVRTIAVTTAMVCYPLGGMLAGLVAGQVLPVHGWRTFFFIGGSMPMVYALILIFLLKESPKYLARQSSRWDELRSLMTRMAHDVAQAVSFTDGRDDSAKRGSIGALFQDGRARDTVWLWLAFFMTLLSIYSAFSWLPMTRFGSRWPMIIWAAMSSVTALALNAVSVTADTQIFLLGLGLHGLFITALQCALYALCAHMYPTSIRVTGAAGALAFGRMGAILSSFVGAAMITAGGATAYLNLLGGSMMVTVVGLAMIRNHIRPVASLRNAG